MDAGSIIGNTVTPVSQTGGAGSNVESESENDNEDAIVHRGNKLVNKFKLSSPNPFEVKLRNLDSVLFSEGLDKKGKPMFNKYSRSCSSTRRRQPVVLSKQQYNHIKENIPIQLIPNMLFNMDQRPKNNIIIFVLVIGVFWEVVLQKEKKKTSHIWEGDPYPKKK